MIIPRIVPGILYFTELLFLCFAIIQYYHAIFETLRGYICEVNCLFHCFSCGYLKDLKRNLFMHLFIYDYTFIYALRKYM